MRRCRDADISFVVQGPIVESAAVTTRQVCASIRQHFPAAEIVVSTWKGANVAGLDADQIVLCDDPGPLFDRDANLNRLLVSSLAGIRRAARPLVMKTRTDILFTSDSVLDYWDQWTEFAPDLRIFRKRVLVPNTFTFKPTYINCHAFHPTDWCFLGLKEDIEFLFDIPLCRAEDLLVETPIDEIIPWIWIEPFSLRLVNEQYLWLRALQKRFPALTVQTFEDLNPENHRQTELAFANNLVALDAGAQYGLFAPKYPNAEVCFGADNLLRHSDWRALYDAYCAPEPGPLPASDTLADLRAAGGSVQGWTQDDPRLTALRRAGHSWEAMLIDCILRAPVDLQRSDIEGLLALKRPVVGAEMIPRWAQAHLMARLAETAETPDEGASNRARVDDDVMDKSFTTKHGVHNPCAQPTLDMEWYPERRAQSFLGSPARATVCMILEQGDEGAVECLQRLAAQTCAQTRFVVVLNGASEPIPAWLTAFIESSPAFLLAHSAWPAPQAALWNHCLHTFASTYFVAVGPGDILSPACIDRLVTVMDHYPDVPVGRAALADELPNGRRRLLPLWAEDAILNTADAAVACLTHPAFTRGAAVQIFRRDAVLSAPTPCDSRFAHFALDELTLRLAVRGGMTTLARRHGSRPYKPENGACRPRAELYREECDLRIHALRELAREGTVAYNRDFVEMVMQRLNLLCLIEYRQAQNAHERAIPISIYRDAVRELRRLIEERNACRHGEAMENYARGDIAQAIAQLQAIVQESPYYGPSNSALGSLLSEIGNAAQAAPYCMKGAALQ
jgi:hypothetical protein